MESEKKCGCKGIRTCLICENEGKVSKLSQENKVDDQYIYCPDCNLCWPMDSNENTNPLYLGQLTVIKDFISEDEETEIIAAIDSMEWSPSQSGRKKQDFGPKVNFKKKKGRIGDFKGFPRFTENLIKRMEQQKGLSDFKPVELCHLDYDPDRGSAIEPHIDDSWIWGERLVTINLASPTILAFTPAKRNANCDCHNQCLSVDFITGKCCSHKILDDQDCSVQTIKQNEHLRCKASAGCSLDGPIGNSDKDNGHCNNKIPLCFNLEGSNYSSFNSADMCTNCDCCTLCIETVSPIRGSIKENNHCDHEFTAECHYHNHSDYLKTSLASNSIKDMSTICDHTKTIPLNAHTMKENNNCPADCSPSELTDPSKMFQSICITNNIPGINTQNKDSVQENQQYNCKVPSGGFVDELNNSSNNPTKDSILSNRKGVSLDELKNCLKHPESNPIKDMCTEYRIELNNVKVLVPLPPRSLVVVAGCCRHNWFHEIKRKDIASRRLAMTFRELSWNFMTGGPDQALGTELLELGRTFWEIKRDSQSDQL